MRLCDAASGRQGAPVKRLTIAILAGFVGAMLAIVGAIAYLILDGVGARSEPSAVETRVARRLRSLAMPSSVTAVKNPVVSTPETIRNGMEHFADHCATCHANDGSGDTEIGRNLYPRAPELRAAETQGLSDGELFYIIEQGVRLTGMPGWSTGTAEGEESTWKLVHFIRHLPKLTEDELVVMQELNPRSPEEFRAEEEERRFLEGDTDEARPGGSQPDAIHRHP